MSAIRAAGGYLPPGIQSNILAREVDLGLPAASFAIGAIAREIAIVAVTFELQTGVSATASEKIGLGTDADPGLLALSDDLAAGKKIVLLWASPIALPANTAIKLFACDAGGAAAGTVGGVGQSARATVSYVYATEP